ncbi:GGDEF domain-containing protein [Methylorubrum salsuginis]|uniref:diguanylate cyclase n=1 Tax=Methylorubrum salsuginis TaxID=414703 RepID=A0A1I3ZN61_9HYPH|nr:GGDEF domain-containing protein [Methylorubrum salsuginis]SFK45512.1 diguanylate cyclase (GGDEF) domain-containing protein [Methylorubrum salsuginis]
MTARSAECVVGLLSFALAAGTIYLTSDGRDIAAVWPANAILLAALLDRRPGTGTGVFVAGFLANLAANVAMRGPSAGLPLYGLCNLVEIGVAARLLRPSLGEGGLLSAPSVVGRFMVVCGLVAPGLSGVGGAATAWLVYGQDFQTSFTTWLFSDGLGLLILTPFFLALLRGEYFRCFSGKDWRQHAEAAGLLLLNAVVAYGVFYLAARPMLFVLFGPVMLVSFRLGRLGTTPAVLIIAAIGAVATMDGHGPIAMVASDPREQAVLFQFFLAALLLTCLPVAAALSARGARFTSLSRNAEDLRAQRAELARLASTDALTGVLNRAAFGATAATAMQDPTGAPLSLIALDLDLFKQVNDRHGHRTGDRALIHLVSVLQTGLREQDAIGRVGGDEFLVLLPGTEFAKAEAVAARLQEALRRTPMMRDDGIPLPLAMSCGVAQHRPNMNFEDFVHVADMALYDAKRAGRRSVSAA